MKTITFDTNTFGILNPKDDRISNEMQEVREVVRKKITEGDIKGFISEASLFIECLEFADKLAYLAVAGTEDSRPTVDQRGVVAVQEMQKLNISMLHAPLIGAEIFIKDLRWAQDECYTQIERQERFSTLGRKLGHPERTVNRLKDIGKELLTNQPPVPQNKKWTTENGIKYEIRQKWAVGLKRAWDNSNNETKKAMKKKIQPIISEWCDILIVSSHYAYGNDIFCTNDRGKEAGNSSILHHSNRENLENYGIKIVTPKDLLNQLS